MDLFKKVWPPLPIMILLFSIFDFLTTTFFQDFLHAPLFFDTIFMIAALFLFGPVAAFLEYIVFICFVSAKLLFLYGTTDYVYVYSLSALTIIFVTWLFSRHKENFKKGVNFIFIYIFLASLLAGFACSVVSGIISYFTYNMNEKDWTFDQIIYAFNGEQLNLLTSAIFGRIPVIALDRVITTFAGFGIFKLYSHFQHRGGVQVLSIIQHPRNYEKKTFPACIRTPSLLLLLPNNS